MWIWAALRTYLRQKIGNAVGGMAIGELGLRRFLLILGREITPRCGDRARRSVLAFVRRVIARREGGIGCSSLVEGIRSYSNYGHTCLRTKLSVHVGGFSRNSLTRLILGDISASSCLALLRVRGPATSSLRFLRRIGRGLFTCFS